MFTSLIDAVRKMFGSSDNLNIQARHITINGKVFEGKNFEVRGSRFFVDGKEVDYPPKSNLSVKCSGDLNIRGE